jgi:hypothetical protein
MTKERKDKHNNGIYFCTYFRWRVVVGVNYWIECSLIAVSLQVTMLRVMGQQWLK